MVVVQFILDLSCYKQRAVLSHVVLYIIFLSITSVELTFLINIYKKSDQQIFKLEEEQCLFMYVTP